MNLSPLKLIFVVLVSMLLGVIITFSFFHSAEIKLVFGSFIFILSLLMMLIMQLPQSGAKQ